MTAPRLALSLPLVALLAAEAQAQDLLAAKHLPARIERYDGATGALVDATFIDIDALVGFGGVTQNIWEVIAAPGGEWWVSNYSAQAVHRFSGDGLSYLGDLPITAGRAVGIAVHAGKFWLATVGGNAPGGVYGFDLGTFTQTNFVAGTNIWDVHPFGGDLLLCRSTGVVERLDVATSAVTPFSTPTGFCEQAFTRAGGGLLVANFGLTGYDEIDGAGNVTVPHHSLALGSIRGVAELSNGSVMLNGTAGLHLFDPATGGSTPLSPGGGSFIGVASSLTYTVHCASNPNSTGVVGRLAATGSNSLAQNDLTLRASALPLQAFGFFLTSRTAASVANPGGSQGVLCLGGTIGRFVGPGQIKNSGGTGEFSLRIDLTAVPQPTGPVAVAAGETWHFQAWFRDSVAGSATSNFTDGIAIGF